MNRSNPTNAKGTRRRLPLTTLGVLLAALLTTASTPASDGTELEFSSIQGDTRCARAAEFADTSDSGTTGVCDVDRSGSVDSGRVEVDTTLTSPMGGVVAWDGYGSGYSKVAATFHLNRPVPRLDFTVRVHVNEATATVDHATGTRRWLGFEPANANPASGRYADVTVSAGARGPAECLPYCGTGGAWIVVSQWGFPGTDAVADQDYVIKLTLRNSCGGLTSSPNCGQIPAGDVIVSAGVGASAGQPDTWGTGQAAVEAVVTSISLD